MIVNVILGWLGLNVLILVGAIVRSRFTEPSTDAHDILAP